MHTQVQQIITLISTSATDLDIGQHQQHKQKFYLEVRISQWL
jgi:hypothetical protein